MSEVLITPAALHAALSTTRPLLLDVRPAESFAVGRLPGAVHLDLWGFSLIDTDPAPLRAFLWMIEHVLALRGVTSERPVVVYGDTSDIRAARVFWFLDYFGHPDVKVLDGGVKAWEAAGLPLTTEITVPVPSTWTGARRDDTLATWRDVLDRLGRADVAMLDTRTDGEHHGTTVRAARGGAIPGSVHIEWTRNLGPDGALKPIEELRSMYDAAGVTADREVVAYCQGAYRAAHSYLALRALGFPRVRNYLGSWKEWGDRLDLPIEIVRRPEPSDAR